MAGSVLTTLVISKLSAKGLANKEMFGKQDPYAEFALIDGEGWHHKKQTKVDKAGGTDPVWFDRIEFEVPSHAKELKVLVYNHNTLRPDDFVGEAVVELGQLRGQQTHTLELKDWRSNRAGTLTFTTAAEFGPARSMQTPPSAAGAHAGQAAAAGAGTHGGAPTGGAVQQGAASGLPASSHQVHHVVGATSGLTQANLYTGAPVAAAPGMAAAAGAVAGAQPMHPATHHNEHHTEAATSGLAPASTAAPVSERSAAAQTVPSATGAGEAGRNVEAATGKMERLGVADETSPPVVDTEHPRDFDSLAARAAGVAGLAHEAPSASSGSRTEQQVAPQRLPAQDYDAERVTQAVHQRAAQAGGPVVHDIGGTPAVAPTVPTPVAQLAGAAASHAPQAAPGASAAAAGTAAATPTQGDAQDKPHSLVYQMADKAQEKLEKVKPADTRADEPAAAGHPGATAAGGATAGQDDTEERPMSDKAKTATGSMAERAAGLLQAVKERIYGSASTEPDAVTAASQASPAHTQPPANASEAAAELAAVRKPAV